MRRIVIGSARIPSAASTPYAEVRSRSVTSFAPSASDSTFCRRLLIPIRFATPMTEGGPIAWISLMEGILIDLDSASRSETAPWNFLS